MSEYIVDFAAPNINAAMALCDGVHEEIVRCRDCRYMRHYHAEESEGGKDFWWCKLAYWKRGVPLNKDSGYCAWGKKEER